MGGPAPLTAPGGSALASVSVSVPERRPLTRQRIVDAAVAFVDAYGLEALSMRKLGSELGVEAMSLYNHVANKDDLLDAVLERALTEVPLPPAQGPWRPRLRALAEGFRTVGLRHPGVLPLFGARPVKTLAGLQPIVCAYDILRTAGLERDEALDAVIAAASYVFGFVLVEEGGFREASREQAVGIAELPPDVDPRLVELGGAIVERDGERQFQVGLEIVLDGIAGRIDGP